LGDRKRALERGHFEIVSRLPVREGERPCEPKHLRDLRKSGLARTLALPGLDFERVSSCPLVRRDASESGEVVEG
jgi:hypothetical protein